MVIMMIQVIVVIVIAVRAVMMVVMMPTTLMVMVIIGGIRRARLWVLTLVLVLPTLRDAPGVYPEVLEGALLRVRSRVS